MSSLTTIQPPPPPDEPVFRLTVEQYHHMIEAGVLTADDRVELIEGILVPKMPKKPKHPMLNIMVTRLFNRLLEGTGWHYRSQEPITLADGEPEPDGAIARGNERDYVDHHPRPQDIALVVEIADTTLRRDRGIKLRSYARAGIQTYWIINEVEQQIEAYTRPNSDFSNPSYESREVFVAGQEIAFALPEKVLAIAVDEIRP